MNLRVGNLTTSECNRASHLLARAFAEDPIITHFLYDRVRRRIAFPAFFRAALEEMLPGGRVYAAHDDDHLIGVAAWSSPDAAHPPGGAQRGAARQRRVVRMLFPLASGRLFGGFATLERFHPVDRHWYLAFIGIEPGFQARGIGRALLTPVLEIADKTNALCYLETPFPRTHEFYERLGFAHHAEHSPFAGAPQGVVTFLREPGRGIHDPFRGAGSARRS